MTFALDRTLFVSQSEILTDRTRGYVTGERPFCFALVLDRSFEPAWGELTVLAIAKSRRPSLKQLICAAPARSAWGCLLTVGAIFAPSPTAPPDHPDPTPRCERVRWWQQQWRMRRWRPVRELLLLRRRKQESLLLVGASSQLSGPSFPYGEVN